MFCQRQIAWVGARDRGGVFEFLPFQTADLSRYGVTREAAEEAMHLVSPSGQVWRGAAAAREIFRRLPSVRFMAWIFALPGAMFIAERVYAWIARRRHRFGCGSESCRLGRST